MIENRILRPDRYVQVVMLFKFADNVDGDAELTARATDGVTISLGLDRRRVGGAVVILDALGGKALADQMNGVRQ